MFGDAFADRSLLDGEFAELFLDPPRHEPTRSDAAIKLLRSFDMRHVTDLPVVHAQLHVPVKLVWGDRDPFFPVDRAQAMVSTFPNASIDVFEGVGLFSHEEAPAEVAASLLPIIAADH